MSLGRVPWTDTCPRYMTSLEGDGDVGEDDGGVGVDRGDDDALQKKYTSVMIRVCHSRSRFLSCMYIHDDFITESR